MNNCRNTVIECFMASGQITWFHPPCHCIIIIIIVIGGSSSSSSSSRSSTSAQFQQYHLFGQGQFDSSALSYALSLRSCLILFSCLGLQMSNVLFFEVPKNNLRIFYVAIPATRSTCPWFHDVSNTQWISTKIWEAPQRVIFSTVVLILPAISGPNTLPNALFHNIVNPFSSISSTCYYQRRNTVCGYLHLS